MQLTLKRKKEQHDRDPLIVIYRDLEKNQRLIMKVDIGQTIELEDEIAHKVLADYKGLFEIKAPEYKNKSMRAEEK